MSCEEFMIVGIDLAGVESRPTGFCVMNQNMNVKTSLLYTDDEIVKETLKTRPKVVAIDAPLALPKGRRSLKIKSNIHLRECDRELLRMKIKFFPITLGPMRKLTERGIRLKKILEKKGLEVIETYPGAAQDIMKIPRKQHGLSKLKAGLEKFGVGKLNDLITGDELDAVTCALVGKFYLKKKHIAIGDKEEILMILPKMDHFNLN